MAVIPNSYDSEQILEIPIPGDDKCFVVSGYASFYSGSGEGDSHPLNCTITGGGLDKRWFGADVEMVVGPKWNSVQHVSPVVSIAGISFRDSDTTDHTGYMVLECEWDTVEASPGNLLQRRIRLKPVISMCGGEQSAVVKLSYHLTAIGRFLHIPHPPI